MKIAIRAPKKVTRDNINMRPLSIPRIRAIGINIKSKTAKITPRNRKGRNIIAMNSPPDSPKRGERRIRGINTVISVAIIRNFINPGLDLVLRNLLLVSGVLSVSIIEL